MSEDGAARVGEQPEGDGGDRGDGRRELWRSFKVLGTQKCLDILEHWFGFIIKTVFDRNYTWQILFSIFSFSYCPRTFEFR